MVQAIMGHRNRASAESYTHMHTDVQARHEGGSVIRRQIASHITNISHFAGNACEESESIARNCEESEVYVDGVRYLVPRDLVEKIIKNHK